MSDSLYCVTLPLTAFQALQTCVALINPASVIHGFFHAGSGCCLQCTVLSLGAGSRNTADLLSYSLWNFTTFAFTRKENKDFHRPVQAVNEAGTGHSPCEKLMVLLKYQSSGFLQVLPTLAFRGVQLLHEQWLEGHS